MNLITSISFYHCVVGTSNNLNFLQITFKIKAPLLEQLQCTVISIWLFSAKIRLHNCYVNCNPFDDCNLQLMIVFFAINAAILLITATISLKPRENYVGLSCDRALFNYITGRTKLPPTFPIYIIII